MLKMNGNSPSCVLLTQLFFLHCTAKDNNYNNIADI
jgi:hypothetical protein